MFFEIGEIDDFQVFIYILGRAGTGKSTLAHNAAAAVYEDTDVKQGDNMIERQFGLWPLMDALIVKFTEVKSNFQLDQAQLQEMVSGGCVSVARKNMIAAQKAKWQAHLVMCGNELPSYKDSQGSLQRRYVIFNMTKKVVNENADLKKRMEEDMPKFVLKCAMAYRELVVIKGIRAGIWNHLPKHFQDNRDSIQNNSLELFLRSDRVRLAKDTHGPETVSFADFKAEYKRFCSDEGITRNVSLSTDTEYLPIFSDNHIVVQTGQIFAKHKMLHGVSIDYTGSDAYRTDPVAVDGEAIPSAGPGILLGEARGMMLNFRHSKNAIRENQIPLSAVYGYAPGSSQARDRPDPPDDLESPAGPSRAANPRKRSTAEKDSDSEPCD
jgi:hypothetical protein